MTIGDRIKEYRLVRGWTRRQLSNRTGFTDNSIFAWERNDYKPSERGIRALEKAFGQQLRK